MKDEKNEWCLRDIGELRNNQMVQKCFFLIYFFTRPHNTVYVSPSHKRYKNTGLYSFKMSFFYIYSGQFQDLGLGLTILRDALSLPEGMHVLIRYFFWLVVYLFNSASCFNV